MSAPSLVDVSPEPQAFEEYFNCANTNVVRFENLGKDAVLVAPCPSEHNAYCSQLASFIRGADINHVHRLWEEVGNAVEDRLDNRPNKPLWVSTSGLGIYWLHVRLDSYPKYYTYKPYTQS